MFTLIATAITAGKALYTAFSGKPVPPQVESMIRASTDLYTAARNGYMAVHDDDGTPMTPAAFAAKFDAWEVAQRAASAGAAARIEARDIAAED